jgi:hypothetical protein
VEEKREYGADPKSEPQGVIDVEQLKLDSPTLLQLKEAGVRLTVPSSARAS